MLYASINTCFTDEQDIQTLKVEKNMDNVEAYLNKTYWFGADCGIVLMINLVVTMNPNINFVIHLFYSIPCLCYVFFYQRFLFDMALFYMIQIQIIGYIFSYYLIYNSK